jgi:hypothetical protein
MGDGATGMESQLIHAGQVLHVALAWRPADTQWKVATDSHIILYTVEYCTYVSIE